MHRIAFHLVMLAIGLAMLVGLGGCSSAEIKQAQANVANAQAQALATPLVNLQFGPDGRVQSLVVGRQNTAIAMPQDQGAEMAREVVRGIVAVGSIAAGGRAAAGLVHAVGDVVGNISGPTTTTTTTTTNTASGSSAAGGGTVSVDSHDATAQPTVVDPVVVISPDPVIVPAADPVIVNPVIITP